MRNIIPKNAHLVPKDAELAFKGVLHEIYQWQQKMYDGSYATFEMLKRPDTLKIIAVKDSKIVVLKQEQPGSPEFFYGLPGGRHDVDTESELDGAKREMVEETGMTFKNWKLLSVRQPAEKVEQFIYTFLATDFDSQTEQNLDSGEKIEVFEVTFEEYKELLKDPRAHYLSEEIFEDVGSIEELLTLPEYS